jgi:cytochrome c oxidase cbb3-type subunit 3
MPSFGEVLEPGRIDSLADHALSLSGGPHDAELAASGAPIFAENCASCHGETGTGGRKFGAPNLSDQIWLYGGAFDQVRASIASAHFGIMPAFGGRLSAPAVREVALYVNTLGGGE